MKKTLVSSMGLSLRASWYAIAAPTGILTHRFVKVCIMIGSSIFSILVHAGYKLENIAMGLLLLATGSLALPALFHVQHGNASAVNAHNLQQPEHKHHPLRIPGI